jgi:hypothetical protein
MPLPGARITVLISDLDIIVGAGQSAEIEDINNFDVSIIVNGGALQAFGTYAVEPVWNGATYNYDYTFMHQVTVPDLEEGDTFVLQYDSAGTEAGLFSVQTRQYTITSANANEGGPMGQYDGMIQINITEGVQGVSAMGFGTQLVLGANANFGSRTMLFTEAGSALAAALAGGVNAPEYKAVQAAFMQSPRPVSVKIGHVRGSKTITDNAGTYTAGPISVTVNGTVVTQAYSSDKATTLTALAAQIAALAAVDTAVHTANAHTTVIAPNAGHVLGISWDLSGITGTMTFTLTATAIEEYSAAVDAIRIVDDDWFLPTTPNRDPAAVTALAAKFETLDKFFNIASADANIANVAPLSDTTSIAAVLKAAGYKHTAGVYLSSAAAAYPDAALAGYLGAQSKPGSYSVAYKKLPGQTPDNLTATQENNILGTNEDPTSGKFFNTYETVGGAGRVRYGKTCGGTYIDYEVFKMWLKARLQEEIFSLMASVPKIPGDLNGETMIRNAMSKPFKQAMGPMWGAITEESKDADGKQTGGFWINFPDLSLRSASDKTARRLSGITFGCWYTDGIHTVQIDGVIN